MVVVVVVVGGHQLKPVYYMQTYTILPWPYTIIFECNMRYIPVMCCCEKWAKASEHRPFNIIGNEEKKKKICSPTQTDCDREKVFLLFLFERMFYLQVFDLLRDKKDGYKIKGLLVYLHHQKETNLILRAPLEHFPNSQIDKTRWARKMITFAFVGFIIE